MLIGIDMLSVQSLHGNREAGRIGRQLVSALLARESGHRFVLYTHDAWKIDDIPSGRNALRIAIDDATRIRDQNPDDLDWLIQLDPFEGPAGSTLDGLKVASLVVDLTPNLVDDRRFNRLRRDDAILAFSEPTAFECRRRLGSVSDRVTTLELACEAASSQAINDLERFGINGPFLFANMERAAERANLASILDAYCLLPTEQRTAFQLVIAGMIDDPWKVVSCLHDRGGAERLVLLSDVEERTLRSLYRDSSAFVTPSLDKGSGFSLIEAMMEGAVIIANLSGSQAEILGDGDLLVDLSNPVEIADRIGRLLADATLRSELGQKSRARSLQYSWTPVVDRVLEILEAGEVPLSRPGLRFDPARAEKSRRPIVGAIRETEPAERSLIG